MPFKNQKTPGTATRAPQEEEEGGSTLAKVGIGAGLLAGGAALASKPGRIGAVAKGLNALRMQLMLSGFALPKSLLGNGGAALTASIERGSLAPIKEMFSGQTLRDAAAAFKRGPLPNTHTGSSVNLPKILSLPGRAMGAFDEAAQGALQRAGLTAEQATNEVLQTPLGKNFGSFGESMEGPVASYLHPFRRTPFNQFIEGHKAIGRVTGGTATRGQKAALGAYGAAGAVHGAATSEDNTPLSIPLAIAASGRHGLPYGVAALIARYATGGKNGGGIAGSVLPVSEYGFEQSLGDVTKPFRKPAALSALDRLMGNP